ncbi:MAG: tetratricopeptide repeat protein [Minicystis sp.]
MIAILASATGCIRVAALPSGPEAEEQGAPQRRDTGGGLSVACQEAKVPHERATACLTLAGYFEEGAFGLPRDPRRAAMLRATAVDTLQASCESGEVADCTRAAAAIGAEIRAVGESDPAAVESAMWMERYAEDGCRGGDAAGCALLGLMYEQGRLVRQDLARAAGYHDQACSGGYRRSCLLLAERAEGKEALRSYERACDAGSGFGCAAAGQHHRKRAGREPGVDAAVYFARGCAMGDPASCVLGVEMYQQDGGANARGAMSFAWTGCRQGIPDACLLLGDAYQRMEGVSGARSAAIDAYKKACDAGLPQGCDALRAAKRKPAEPMTLIPVGSAPDSAHD